MQVLQCVDPACGLRFPGEAGIACPLCGATTRVAAERLCFDRQLPASPARATSLLVDNVRSVFNVGSMFRTGDGAGLLHIYLCGISPTPEHPAIDKTALGAQHMVPWSKHLDGAALAAELRAQGKRLWALEGVEGALPLERAARERPDEELVLVLGHEVTGVDPGILEHCEERLYIPMRGRKDSLNVATAMGIAAYALS